jgi:hypothetical protein
MTAMTDRPTRAHSDGDTAPRAPEWGPVCRGYQVLLPHGERGLVEDIHLGDDGVELLVSTGFVRRHLTIHEGDIEEILPAAYQVVVRGSRAAGTGNGAEHLKVAGGILRMPVLHSLRPGSLPEDPA